MYCTYLGLYIQYSYFSLPMNVSDGLQFSAIHGILVRTVFQVLIVTDIMHHLFMWHKVVVTAAFLTTLWCSSCVWKQDCRCETGVWQVVISAVLVDWGFVPRANWVKSLFLTAVNNDWQIWQKLINKKLWLPKCAHWSNGVNQTNHSASTLNNMWLKETYYCLYLRGIG